MESKRTVAIASLGTNGLEAEVSAHFGRCPHYILVEVSTAHVGTPRVIDNPGAQGHKAGVVPAFINELGAHVIIAGGMGPRAIQYFNNFGIEVVTGAAGRVGTALDAWRSGQLKGILPCEHDHPKSCGGH